MTTAAWQTKPDFPPFIQPMPHIFHKHNIIYGTRYQLDNEEKSGIFEYDSIADTHSTLELWSNCNYYPRWNITIYSSIRETLIMIGGVNVKDNHSNYNLLVFYKMENELIVNGYIRQFELHISIPNKLSQIITSFYRHKATLSTIQIKYTIGANCKLLLTHNDKYLHIIGGTENSYHILYDLDTYKSIIIRAFIPQISEQGIFHIKSLNSIAMFGGFSYANHIAANQSFFDDFWILNLNEYVSLLPMEKLTSNLVYGYVKNTLMHVMICPFGYDIAINDIIEMYLVNDENKIEYSQWEKVNKYKMPVKLHGFGSVLYDDRVIIMFGGKIEGNHQRDNIYYLDLNSNNGWKECMLKVPKPGSCNAVLINHKIIHILPYSSYTNHWSIHVKDLLPATLV